MRSLERLWWELVRFGFRLLYNEFAWTYDLVSWSVSLGHWRKWQRTAIPHLKSGPNDLILELAHGTGNLQIDMAEAGLRAFALDISPFMGRIAQRKLRRKGLQTRFVRGSGMNLPFSTGTFRAAVSTFPTEFIVRRDTLNEIYRVLQPGGVFVMIPNGMLTLANPLARFLEWLYQVTGQRGPWPNDPLIAFRQAGFETEMLVEQLKGSQAWVIVARKPELNLSVEH